MMEIWHDIEGYEGLYQISNKGNVKRLYKTSEKILKPKLNTNGYLRVQLYKNRNLQNRYIHRLVAEAFIPNSQNKPQVNHKDENKKNNCVENLEWMTSKENNNYGTHAERSGLNRRKSILQYSKSEEFINEWPGICTVEEELGFSHASIIKCCLGKLKSAYGFIWRYKEKD